MENTNFNKIMIIIGIIAIVIIIMAFYLNDRIDEVEKVALENTPSTITHYTIKVEKVIGHGNVIGVNNTTENNINE